MDIGKEKETIIVEPAIDPVPRRESIPAPEREREREPVEPEFVPA